MSNRAATIARFERLKAECLASDPVTDEDREEHRRLCARQRARDEEKRQPSPQIELPEAA